MYSKEDLIGHNDILEINKIDLKVLQQFYVSYLMNYKYTYELKNGQTINIIFYEENLCHLLGLQYIYNHERHYLGKKGFDKIALDKITMSKIKTHNKKQFNYIKLKLKCFHMIVNMLDSKSDIYKFYEDRVDGNCLINANYLCHYKNKTYGLHLFLRKECDSSNLYAPVSFVVKSENDRNINFYTKKQEHKPIKSFVKTKLTITTDYNKK